MILRRFLQPPLLMRAAAALVGMASAWVHAATPPPAHPEHPAPTPAAPSHETPAAEKAPAPAAHGQAPKEHPPETPGHTSEKPEPGHAEHGTAAKIPDPHATPKVTPAAAPAHTVPDEIQGMLKIGAGAVERRDFDAAEIAFRQVIAAPRAPERDIKIALTSLAQMHRRKGEFTKAAAIYERYLKDYAGDERTPDVLLDLGRTLRSLGAHRLAITRFYNVLNSTLKLSGEGFDRYQLLAKTAQFEIAETHFLSGEFAEANKFYTRLRLLDLAPVDRARAHFKAGYAIRLQGNLETAVTTLRSYLEQWPDDENVPEARYLLAVTLRELKRSQDAFNATLDLLRTEKSRIETDPKR